MINANSLINSPSGHDVRLVEVGSGNWAKKNFAKAPVPDLRAAVKAVRAVVMLALEAVDDARRKCLAAGQVMNEYRASFARTRGPNGEFDDNDGFTEWVTANIPEITDRTARRWMQAARNVTRALPAPPSSDIEAEIISISEILSLPDEKLSDEAREWRQAWFDFTEGKTLKDCLAGVFVDGDEESRAVRAINGKTKGGAGGDRKDFPLFIAVKLKDMGSHFGHWGGMDALQRSTAQNALRSAILGEEVKVGKRLFKYEVWPEDICRLAIEALRERLKR